MKTKVAAAITVAMLLVAIPAQAHAAIRLTKVQYDSPGTDNRSNSSLNAEYVVIKNTGARARSLKSWTLRDKAGHVYRFGAYRLRAGRTVTIHTGRGSNTASHRYWGMRNYVWNNTGDKAILRNASGRTIDTCTWSGGSTATRC